MNFELKEISSTLIMSKLTIGPDLSKELEFLDKQKFYLKNSNVQGVPINKGIQ